MAGDSNVPGLFNSWPCLHHAVMKSKTGPDPVLHSALLWHQAGTGAVLVTVLETWGSAPRPVGAQMAVSGAGDMVGSVSGGCVEGAVVTEALAALRDGVPRVIGYQVSDSSAFALGLACGGSIRVMVEPVGSGALAIQPKLLAEVIAAKVAAAPVAVVTDLGTWARKVMRPDDDPVIAARLREDRAGMEEAGRFVAVHAAPLRLIVVGAVHIAQSLLPMAHLCGYLLTLIDPRSSFASAARFPDQEILDDWPDEAIAAQDPDARTAVVTLTHDAKLDDPALRAALATDAFYVGCLGSRRTHAARLDRLRAGGVAEADLVRLHAPVGLAIGARTPGEIAISIMAQMTQVLRGT
jgi:xanthine dehydrogenase accessory factor